jgi:ABC-2 type transport system ATP-binding protein
LGAGSFAVLVTKTKTKRIFKVVSEPVIQIEHLRKVYGTTVAVDDVSFEVHQGEIFGMVGTNGAGKTTSIECIEGLRQQDSGSIRVFGVDPQKEIHDIRRKVGVQLQESQLQPRLKVWEALDLFASFYESPLDWEKLLEQLGLTDKRNTAFAVLSGGQKQRLQIALALINDPQLVFFDELTTGLDPQARRAMWDLIRSVRDSGKTIFLTTHFMDEAERLCDRVAIMDKGKIIALDTPENLIQSLGVESRVVFTLKEPYDIACCRGLSGVTLVEQNGDRVLIQGRGDMLVVEVVTALAKEGIRFSDLRTEQPNLEDVFLAVTGHEMKE